jgi:methyl-accepting chemotaxis protein
MSSSEIAASSQEQSVAVQQLVTTIAELEKGMIQTQEISHDSAKAAEGLTNEVASLKQISVILNELMGKQIA